MVSFEPDPLFDLTVVGLPRNLNTFLSCVILIRDDLQLWIYFICEEGGGMRMRIRGWIHFKQCVNLETPIVADVLLTEQ